MTQPPTPEVPSINHVLREAAQGSPTEFAAALNAPGLGGALAAKVGLEVLEASAERVVGRIPVEGNTQPYGLLHGGATVVLAESLGSIAAALHAGPDHIALGIEVSATHHRSPRSGWVTASVTPLHRGRTVASYQIEVLDDDGRRIATARLTCMLRPINAD
jgi:uncharacterized protein (TIGR00369 family)